MHDYKDLYETEDLPEAEKDYEEEIKDCIEKLSVAPLTAFNRFKGKEIPIAGVPSKSKSVLKDNPYDRARHILTELEHLSKDIQNNYEVNIANKTEPVTKEHLMLLVEGLSIQVKELDLNKYFGPEASFEIKDPKKIIYKKLIQSIDQLIDQSDKESNESNPVHSYVLTSNVEVNEHLNQIKLANLYKRLDALEKVLGDDNVKLSNIVSDCPNKGLVEAIERLFAKTSLLNNPQLNVIDSRLAAVSNKLQNLTTVASNADNLDQISQTKISELYELVKKWDHVMDAVPSIIDHCVSMQDFHFKAVKLGQCITHIDTRHQQMRFKQQTSQMALKNMQINLSNNFQTMEKNMTIIDEKLKSLS